MIASTSGAASFSPTRSRGGSIIRRTGVAHGPVGVDCIVEGDFQSVLQQSPGRVVPAGFLACGAGERAVPDLLPRLLAVELGTSRRRARPIARSPPRHAPRSGSRTAPEKPAGRAPDDPPDPQLTDWPLARRVRASLAASRPIDPRSRDASLAAANGGRPAAPRPHRERRRRRVRAAAPASSNSSGNPRAQDVVQQQSAIVVDARDAPVHVERGDQRRVVGGPPHSSRIVDARHVLVDECDRGFEGVPQPSVDVLLRNARAGELSTPRQPTNQAAAVTGFIPKAARVAVLPTSITRLYRA